MSTVAAIGTPHGKGGVAMIRITGEDSHSVAACVFSPVNGERFAQRLTGRTYYGRFRDEQGFFDDGIVILYSEKNSYTGECAAELYCHGGLLVAQKLLSAVLAAGAESALPGEFTKRAFVNGRITLTGAEAVGGIIDAVSPKYLSVSANQAAGSLSKVISSLCDRMKRLAASVYAFIDYPDEDMTEVSPDEMRDELSDIKKILSSLSATYGYGKAISEGINVSIVGRPNTGKSTLMNLLCRCDRAIVTDIAGTTRDVITEKANVNGVILNLSDTAGIREGVDELERLGISRSRRSLEGASLVLAVFDSSLPPDDDDKMLAELIRESGKENVTLCVMNKSDLPDLFGEPPFGDPVFISAKSGEGIDALEKRICAFAGESSGEEGEIITNARQFAALSKAESAVCDAIASLADFTEDVAGMDIERALGYLGEADGRQVSEDIVNEIFSHFCVGK